MKRAVLFSAVLLASCGKKPPEQQANVPDANPPAQPPVKEAKQPQTKSMEKPFQPSAKPKEELTLSMTPGMEVAKKAHDAVNYREAVRFYTVEQAAEKVKSAPS